MDKFKEGRMTILTLIRLFDEDGKKELKDMLLVDFSIKKWEATDMSDLISQLSSLKSDHEDWFEEYPIQVLIDLNQISSPFFSPSNSSTINNLTFSPPLKDQLEDVKLGENLILDGYDLMLNRDVKVKVSNDDDKLRRECENLKELRRFHEERGKEGDEKYFMEVLRDEVEELVVEEGVMVYGMVMERGVENMNRFLYSKHQWLNDNERVCLGESLVKIVSLVHESGKVWMDCKLSNVVYFPTDYPEWKGIDFEYTLDEGVEIPSDHGCTIAYAPPELVRYLFVEEEEKKGKDYQTLISSKSMDMWSVGVCLLEIVTGEGLGENLELVGGKDGLREFYCLKSDKEIDERIGKMLMRKLREEKYRHLKRLLGELLVVDGEERLKIGEVVDHAFLSRDKGTTTKAMMNRLERELDSRSENKRQFDEMKKRSVEIQATLETIVGQNEEIIDEEGVTQDLVENAQIQQYQSHQQTKQDYNFISDQVIEMMDELEGSKEWMEEDQKERFQNITKMTTRASNVEEMRDCLEFVEGLYEDIPHEIDEEEFLS